MDIRRGFRIPVYGLGCGGAGATTIERELAATDGVVRAYVNPATETAYVDYDPAEADAWVLVRAIERAGYTADTRIGHGVHEAANHGQ
jgi:cation transport ATPase